MKLKLSLVVGMTVLALLTSAGWANAQSGGPGGHGQAGPAGTLASVGSGFTYQGKITSGGNPVSGNCDLQFGLWKALSVGTQSGVTQTVTANVTNGVFTALLNNSGQFGFQAFNGEARYLAITVRCPAGSGSYTNLSPRQELTAAPYAQGLKPQAYVYGTVPSGVMLTVENYVTSTTNYGDGIYSYTYGPNSWSVVGSTEGIDGSIGVLGSASSPVSVTYGVYGASQSDEGYGVYGRQGFGSGLTTSFIGPAGVWGDADTEFGVIGTSNVIGALGYQANPTSPGFGVLGLTPSVRRFTRPTSLGILPAAGDRA